MSQVTGTRRRGLDSLTVRILLGLGFVLAVVASLFVVFADEVRWLRLAVLLALWAALLTAFAMARYRRNARAAELRQEEMTRIYELELHREISARREYEVQLADSTRVELESRHDAELGALREQVERLTTVLSGFLDGDLLVERLTLSAEATRIRSVGDVGSAQAIGSVARRLVEGSVGPAGAAGPFNTGPAWGPQPPPLRGPLPAPPLDASSGAVTEQIPRIVELAAPTPVIDAVPATPRVVGDPHRAAETPDGSDAAARADHAQDKAGDARDGQPAAAEASDDADEELVVRSAAVESDAPEELEDLIEVEHGATEPEPETAPDSESESESESGSEGEGASAADSAGPEFRPAIDVPDIPARVDSPATAWTLRHRLDTPAAPPVERTSGSRRAARAAGTVAADQPSEAVAEITGGAKDSAGHSSGVSVAELLAAYGGSVPPRRRRHSDDA